VQIARGVIGLVVTGHYPLNHHPGRLAIEHLEQYCFGWKEISQWFSYLQSIIFVLSTTAVAIVVSVFSSSKAKDPSQEQVSNALICQRASGAGAPLLEADPPNCRALASYSSLLLCCCIGSQTIGQALCIMGIKS